MAEKSAPNLHVRVPKESDDKRFYFDGISFIFELEDDGNSRMICEVRGEGDGMFKENADMLVEALNSHYYTGC